MVVERILNGFYTLFNISPNKTFQYLDKIANANGYKLKNPKSNKLKNYIKGGNTETIQSLITLVFVFLAYIINTKTIQSYSQTRLKELKDATSIQKFLKEEIEKQNNSKAANIYFLKDKELYYENPQDLFVENSSNSLYLDGSSNPQSPIENLLLDLPELVPITTSTESIQSLVSSIFPFPLGKDESDSENEEFSNENNIQNYNQTILEETFKTAANVLNQVALSSNTIQENNYENLLDKVNRFNGQSIVRRNINRIEQDIKRQQASLEETKLLKLKSQKSILKAGKKFRIRKNML